MECLRGHTMEDIIEISWQVDVDIEEEKIEFFHWTLYCLFNWLWQQYLILDVDV